ncbi:MAG: ElyC/SanA/YdcF family protein [Patescibacteria group bacterium]
MEKRHGIVIVPITKFPGDRKGPAYEQDWYEAVKHAKTLLNWFHNEDKSAFILVLSDVMVDGYPHEADTYHDALREIGVEEKDIEVVKEGQETVGQIEWLKQNYDESDIWLLSVRIHAPRVRYICKKFGLKANHKTIHEGKKRTKEAITDFILNFAFPVIHFLGLTKWFQKKVVGRRKSGKH